MIASKTRLIAAAALTTAASRKPRIDGAMVFMTVPLHMSVGCRTPALPPASRAVQSKNARACDGP